MLYFSHARIFIAGAKYEDQEIQIYRRAVWETNLLRVNKHNSQYLAGRANFQMEMNQFADQVWSKSNRRPKLC